MIVYLVYIEIRDKNFKLESVHKTKEGAEKVLSYKEQNDYYWGNYSIEEKELLED